MNRSLTITFSSSLKDEDIWVKLTQVVEEDQPTLKEAAEVLDALYEITPCDVDLEPKEDPIAEDHFEYVISSKLRLSFCSLLQNKDFLCDVIVSRSDIGLPYTIDFTNGQLVSTSTIDEFIDETIIVKEQSEFQLDFPIIGDAMFYWKSAPIGDSGDVFNAPKILYTESGKLYWGEKLTGAIYARYKTTYDIVKVKVFNTDGEIGESDAVCFYDKATDVITLSIPEETAKELDYKEKFCHPNVSVEDKPEKDPWVTTETKYYCECSGEYSHSVYSTDPNEQQKLQYSFPGITKEINGGYVGCGETTGDINSPEFYEETCCKLPTLSLPNCSSKRVKKSPVGINFDTTVYPVGTRFTPIAPDDGDCGSITFKQVKNSKDCCDLAPPLTIPEDLVLSPGASISLRANGGIGPLVWEVGVGLIIENISIDTYTIWLRVTEDFCGNSYIKVVDICNTMGVTSIIKSTVGAWRPVVWGSPYDLPPGFSPGPADDPGPTELCGAFSLPLPYIRVSGKWRVSVSYLAEPHGTAGCAAIPGDAGAITLITGLGMSPESVHCRYYECFGQEADVLGGGCCRFWTVNSSTYATYYQRISQVWEWAC